MFGFTDQQKKEIRQIIREELRAIAGIEDKPLITPKPSRYYDENPAGGNKAGAPGDYNPAK